MSYINKKGRVFMERKDLRPERRRSESRMKKYPSTIDIRAWCDFVEDRRQHILELVVQNVEKCMGKLIPVDKILDVLLSKYKADIADLEKCLKSLWDIVKNLDLPDNERKKLENITNNMTCREILDIEDTDMQRGRGMAKRQMIEYEDEILDGQPSKDEMPGEQPSKDGISDEEPPKECVAKARHDREAAEIENLVGKGTYTVKMHGPGKMKTRIKGIQPGFNIASDGTPVPGGIKVKAQNGKADIWVKNVYPSPKKVPSTSTDEATSSKPQSSQPTNKRSSSSQPITKRTSSSQPIAKGTSSNQPITKKTSFNQPITKKTSSKSEPLSPPIQNEQSHNNTKSPSPKSRRSASSPPRSSSPINTSASDMAAKEETTLSESGAGSPRRRPASPEREESSFIRGRVTAKRGENSPGNGSESPTNGGSSPKGGSASPVQRPGSPRRGVPPKADRSGSPEEVEPVDGGEAAKLRDQLAAREALCNELQVNVKSLKAERDDLQDKLNGCLKELENFKKLSAVANPVIPSSCQEEIEALEVEIKLMRSGNLSPEQEAAVIKKEVEILKRYCSKLKTIEDENDKLKIERDTLKSQVAIAAESTESNELPAKVKELEAQLEELEAMTKERNLLASQVKELEGKLKQYENLPGEVEVLRQRSDMLDTVLEERDVLSKKASQIKDMENEINMLRQKADRVDELERELKAMSKYDRSSGYELRKSISRNSNLERELANIQAEKEAMSKRMDSMRRESESYRGRAKECEMLKLERDRLQIKLNELGDIQMQYDSMIANMKQFDSLKAERDTYKQKYEEVLQMECQCEMLKNQVDAAHSLGRERDALQRQVGDLESCICEQEEEIKRLVCHIDNMAKNKDETNNRMKDAVANMKAEIEKKDALLVESEERLAAVQSQVRSSIQDASNETTMLRRKVDDLEMQLQEKNCYIKCLETKLKERESVFRYAKGINNSQQDNADAIRRELEAAKAENRKLQDIANKMMSLSGDEHVRKMLKQSECAVRRVVDELGKQYREWDNMRNKHQKARQSPTKKENCCCRHPAIDFPISASCEKLKEEMDIIQREKEKLEKIVRQIQADNLGDSQNELASLRIEKANLEEQLERERKLRASLERKINV